MNTSLIKELRDLSGAGLMDCKKALEASNNDIDEAIDYLRKKGISKAAKKADRVAAEGLSTVVIDGNNASIVEVNCETDFVAKNEKFVNLVNKIAELIVKNDVKTMEEAMSLSTEEGTLNDTIVNFTATIGEKISFRRFARLSKTDSQNFGSYIHMGGRIAVLTLLEGADEETAKDVSMHAAAMRPSYVKREDVPAEEVERETSVLKEQAMNEGKPAEIAEKMVNGRINKFYKEICLEEQDFVKDSDMTVGAFVKSKNGSIVNMVRFEVGEGIEKKEENFAEEVMNQIKG
ncbi:MAG: elongation factor Ts [Bacilli bacterium]|jgi:elongation factor Ts|nr:elongation factor Ts [Bacilli bacterium]HCJ32056.1 elongation factor Ts [Bacillota bacterium]